MILSIADNRIVVLITNKVIVARTLVVQLPNLIVVADNPLFRVM